MEICIEVSPYDIANLTTEDVVELYECLDMTEQVQFQIATDLRPPVYMQASPQPRPMTATALIQALVKTGVSTEWVVKTWLEVKIGS